MQTMIFILCAVLFAGMGGRQPGNTRAGVPFDLQAFVNREIAAGHTTITVPPGTYRVSPQNRAHLTLQNLQNITLIANNVEMVCTQTCVAINLVNCKYVTVRGLTIDYDPLPFTQGRIVAMSADKSVHTIEIFQGYPTADTIYNYKYEIFRPDTRTLRCATYYPLSVQEIDPLHFTVTKPSGQASDPEQIGDIVAIASNYAPGGSSPHAVTLSQCTNVRFESMNLYASNNFGFYESACNGTVYSYCQIDRCPPENDLYSRGDPRIRSLDADAFHSIGATKGPALVGCLARFMGDDAVSVHGSYSMVTAVNGNTLRVLTSNGPLLKGEPVEIWTYAGVRLPDAVVTSVVGAGSITQAERTFVLQQNMDATIKTTGLSSAYLVTLNRAVDLAMGSMVCPTQRMGNGFIVRDCTFGYNRSRGIVVKADSGTLIGNIIEGTWLQSVLVSPEYYWLEGGNANNVLITGNTIIGCVMTPIDVESVGGTGLEAPAGAHNNITITNNLIISCPLPNIFVTSTDTLLIQGNRFQQPVNTGGSPLDIQTDQCTNVTISAGVQTGRPSR